MATDKIKQKQWYSEGSFLGERIFIDFLPWARNQPPLCPMAVTVDATNLASTKNEVRL